MNRATHKLCEFEWDAADKHLSCILLTHEFGEHVSAPVSGGQRRSFPNPNDSLAGDAPKR